MVTGEMFEPVAGELAQRHRLIVPDLRGSGRSRHLAPPYSVEQQAADLAQLLGRLNIDAADVLGYSQGGAVAQQLALDHPNRVRRLILANTYAYNMATVKERIEGKLAPLLIRLLGMRLFAQFVIAVGTKQVPDSSKRRIIEILADQDASLMTTAWHEAMRFDSRDRLGEIECPTLIIAGAGDNAVPMHHARTLHAGIANSKLIVVEGADHALLWARSETLVSLAEDFLR